MSTVHTPRHKMCDTTAISTHPPTFPEFKTIFLTSVSLRRSSQKYLIASGNKPEKTWRSSRAKRVTYRYSPALISRTLPTPNCCAACHLIYDDAEIIQQFDTVSGSKETVCLIIRQRTGHLPIVRAQDSDSDVELHLTQQHTTMAANHTATDDTV
jgi:hypothetical protein